MDNITVAIDAGAASAKLEALAAKLKHPRDLFQAIAQVLESETEANFKAQGRPGWTKLADSTVKERLKRNKGGTVLQILQDSGILAGSISSDYGDDFARVGAATPYAAIHQFGGTIVRPAHLTKVRLRTDAKGQLVRQGDKGRSANLAVFAKKSHKLARESRHEVGEYTIDIPARPYLPFKGTADNAVLQPEAERSILDEITKWLEAA